MMFGRFAVLDWRVASARLSITSATINTVTDRLTKKISGKTRFFGKRLVILFLKFWLSSKVLGFRDVSFVRPKPSVI
jgi:hypothetical protein